MMYAGIVFYNKYVEESRIIPMLKKNGYTVVVYDNSSKAEILSCNKEYSKKENIVYISEGKNLGVSYAYTRIVDAVKNKAIDPKVDWITMFDDDSIPTDNYFKKTELTIKNINLKGVLLPIVLSDKNVIVSPSRIGNKRGYLLFNDFDEALQYNGDDLSGINSGMVINLDVFNHVSYDTRLFIDHIDHDFIKKAKAAGIPILVFDGTIQHSLSEFELPSIESSKFRFKKYIDDSKIYYDKRDYYYHVLRRLVKYSFTYRTIAFVKILLNK